MKLKGGRFRIVLASMALTGLISVALSQWSPSVNVSRTTGLAAWYPSLTMDSAGTLHASWSHRTTSSADWIEYSCKPAGVDTWTIPVHVSRDSFMLRMSVIGIGPGGVPCIVWCSEAQSGHLYAARKSGDTWTTPERNQHWSGGNTGIRAAADCLGRVHVVWWLDYDHIWYARYESSGWTVPESIVSSQGGASLVNPSVAVDRYGHAHVVFQGSSLGYLHQTDSGWTAPIYIPASPDEPRIALDTADRPQLVWDTGRPAYFSGWTGDSWVAPQRLDSISSFLPTVCVDSWNRVHVFFGDGNERFHVGMRERVWFENRWIERLLVDTIEGAGEPVAGRDKLHLLWLRRAPHYDGLLYSYRSLEAPGAAEKKELLTCETAPTDLSPVTPSSLVRYVLSQPSLVEIDVLDSAGRIIRHLTPVILQAGRHEFRPYSYLPRRGVFFCRITHGDSTKTVKVVKVN